MICGGNIKDIPLPHQYKWPDSNRQREVKVTITTYVGFSPGAKHYYCELKEEDNPVWDSSEAFAREGEAGWTICWDHPEEKKGRCLESGIDSDGQFFDKGSARAWAREMFYKHFPNHKPFELFDNQLDWIYTREGD